MSDICSPILCDIWTENIVRKGNFSKDLKNADATLVFKKENSLLAKNYRPVSILPTFSKKFERLIQKQIIYYKPISLILAMWIQKMLY